MIFQISSLEARRNVFKTTGNLLQTVKKHQDILRDLLNKFSKSAGTLSRCPCGSAGPDVHFRHFFAIYQESWIIWISKFKNRAKLAIGVLTISKELILDPKEFAQYNNI